MSNSAKSYLWQNKRRTDNLGITLEIKRRKKLFISNSFNKLNKQSHVYYVVIWKMMARWQFFSDWFLICSHFETANKYEFIFLWSYYSDHLGVTHPPLWLAIHTGIRLSSIMQHPTRKLGRIRFFRIWFDWFSLQKSKLKCLSNNILDWRRGCCEFLLKMTRFDNLGSKFLHLNARTKWDKRSALMWFINYLSTLFNY